MIKKYTENKKYLNNKIYSQLKGFWEVGDTCINEYKVKIVKERNEDGQVTALTDGYFESNYLNYNDEIFPVTSWTLRVIDSIKYNDKELRKFDRLNLNWPDIHRKFREFCTEGCKLCFEDYNTREECELKFKDFYDRLQNFTNKIKEKCEKLKNDSVDGISLFRK